MAFSSSQTGAPLATLEVPTYDEQIGTTFTQNLGALTYNVTALAQTDSDGFGPAYILNGVTTAGYWYQVGISYHWPSVGGGYNTGFAFSYQVYGPSGRSVYPQSGSGLGSFSKVVDSGDSVLLSLTFTGASVQMLAQDWKTGAIAKTSYNSVGASSFVGNPSSPSDSHGYFSGLMTEWYHVGLYAGNEGKVTYTNTAIALNSAWLWADEFQSSGLVGGSGSTIFSNKTQNPVTFSNEQQLYPFASNGVTIYGSAHQFITGLLNTATSKVVLNPASPATGNTSFVASYTLAGLQQTSEVDAQTPTAIEADPGTSITLSVNSSTSSPLEKWVFSGATGTSITLAAGSNATYVYYELVEETVSLEIIETAGGPPLPQPPVLTYEIPSSLADTVPQVVTATQLLQNSTVEIFALLGSTARVPENVTSGVGGERWATPTQNFTVSAPNSFPDPIPYYYQYQITLEYFITGGGTPSQVPTFTSAAFGTTSIVNVTGGSTLLNCPQPGCSGPPPNGVAVVWFDAGRMGGFTTVLNGTGSGERWMISGVDPGNVPEGAAAGFTIPLSPGGVVSAVYAHQYYIDLGYYEPGGGSISSSPNWYAAGTTLNVTASANPQWQFEGWSVGRDNSSFRDVVSSAIEIFVNQSSDAYATFYEGMTLTTDPGSTISFSYATQPIPDGGLSGRASGVVGPGTTKTIYLAPATNVTLRAAPASLIYSFGSWDGQSVRSPAQPSLALVVNSPTSISTSSSYDYPVFLGIVGLIALAVIGLPLFVRRSRKKRPLYGFGPA